MEEMPEATDDSESSVSFPKWEFADIGTKKTNISLGYLPIFGLEQQTSITSDYYFNRMFKTFEEVNQSIGILLYTDSRILNPIQIQHLKNALRRISIRISIVKKVGERIDEIYGLKLLEGIESDKEYVYLTNRNQRLFNYYRDLYAEVEQKISTTRK